MLSFYKNVSKKLSKSSKSYAEWLDKAKEYDSKKGLDEWREEDVSHLYDFEEIRVRLEKLKKYRESGDDHAVLFTLNEGIHGNMGGMGNPKLYNKALSGTKNLIVEYVNEVADSIQHIADLDHSNISLEDKIDFFARASHCFGRTALMLSGGGQLGNFHMGVLKALIEQDLLPNVISGSSAGSIFAAMVGTKTKEELKEFFKPANLAIEVEREKGLMSGVLKKRTSVKISHVVETVERVIPDLTFQEAFEKTGKFINISVAPYDAHQKSRLLNSTASPNVMIRTAVLASCAVPGVFPPVSLIAKNKDGQQVPYLPTRKWVDGSMSNDLPSKRLTRLFGVNHFIVSFTNPVILPFVKDTAFHNEWLTAIRRFGTSIIKETTQFNYSIAKPFFKYWPTLAVAANGINSVVQQNYQGDINITADFSVVKPINLLSSLTVKEIADLIENGEKATWPQMERIRVATKIARVLDEIRTNYLKEELELAEELLSQKEHN